MSGEARTKQIRVMLVENHPDFRDFMEVLLGSQSDIKLVAQAGSLAETRNRSNSTWRSWIWGFPTRMA